MSAHVWERMSAYIDRELPQTERAGVEAHLRECADCARAIEEMRAVDALAREHEVEAPTGYFDGLPGRLRARLSPRTRARIAPWTLALAAGLAVAVLAPLALRERPPLPPAPEAASAPAVPPAPATAVPEAAYDRPAPVGARARAFSAPPARNQPADGLAKRERGDAAEAKPNLRRQREEVTAGRHGDLKAEEQARRGTLADQRETRAMGAIAPPPAVPAEVDAAGQEAEAEDDAPLVSDNSGPGRESSARPPSAAAGAPMKSRPADPRFQALAGRAARSAAEARALRDAWQAYVRDNPEGPHADEARVSALEAGAAAWRLGGLREDRVQVERDGREYLRRPEAADKERVRALLAGLAPH
jgi:hypothetical protein